MSNFTIYGKRTGCPNCEKVKNLCDMRGISYDYLIIEEDVSISDLKEMAGSEVKTAPVIFTENKEFLGGLEEFKQGLINGDF